MLSGAKVAGRRGSVGRAVDQSHAVYDKHYMNIIYNMVQAPAK
jgi:hypothetical protein